MAGDKQAAMDMAEMKALLRKSKVKPMNCAIAQADGAALILLDKIKAPKAVLKELQKQFPDAEKPLWGTAHVDEDADPKKVTFCVNKAAPGLGRKLVKALKGSGFSKVALTLEDGSEFESESDEDAATPELAAPASGAAPPPAPPDAAPAGDDGAAQAALAEATHELADLVKRLMQAPPALRQDLQKLAVQAQAMLKQGDLAGAHTASMDLQHGLEASAAGGPKRATKATLAKARSAWVLSRQRMESDVSAVEAALTKAFRGHHRAADIGATFSKRVEPVLAGLDHALSDRLDALSRNDDPAEHEKGVRDVHATIDRYRKFIANDSTIAELDTNPFVKVSIRGSIEATLAALSRAVV